MEEVVSKAVRAGEPLKASAGDMRYIRSVAAALGLEVDVDTLDHKKIVEITQWLRAWRGRTQSSGDKGRRIAFGLATKLVFSNYQRVGRTLYVTRRSGTT